MPFRIIAALLLGTTLCAPASTPQRVSVLYAGSLVTPMEGPIARALAARGILFDGEGAGSKELANLILAGLRSPDVVLFVDPSIVEKLARRGLIAQSWTFGSASLGIGWSRGSPRARTLDRIAHSRTAILDTLNAPGIRIARTDPRLDPKGVYTIEAIRILAGRAGERAILGNDENEAQIFPEQDLLVRIETGEADLGFVYSIEASARHFDFIPLPGRASLSDRIRFTIAIMTHAPHPNAAREFVDFILHGRGRSILKAAGVTYLR